LRLGEKQVPAEEIPARLADAADELIRLREELTRLRSDRPELAPFRTSALALINQGKFDAARAITSARTHGGPCVAGRNQPLRGRISRR
jgi:hypothetical protein